MEVLILLIPIAMIFAGLVAVAFFWAANSGQFDDLDRAGDSIFREEDQHPEERE